MDLLGGTPYILEGANAEAVSALVQAIVDRISLLRRQGHLDDATLASLRQEWNVEQVYESAGIEGNRLTLNETRLAISRGITISGKPPEHSDEVVLLSQAHEYLERLVREKGPITSRELLDVHTLILGRGTQGAGELRRVEVKIGDQKHKPPPPTKVLEQMGEYFQWLARAQGCPIPLLAAVAHAWLVHIHPFRDGNGRAARAITNLLLMRHGYPIVIIRRKDRQRYYDALAQSDDGDIGPLLELISARLEDSLRQIDRVRTAATGVSLEMERIAAAEERRLAVWNAAVGLLCEELAGAFQDVVDNDPSFLFDWRRYELLEMDDYRQLARAHAISQSWLARYRLSRGAKSFELLLWAGFASNAMQLATVQPVVFVSERNPVGYPQWRTPTAEFATSLREVAYVDGRFLVRREDTQPVVEESTVALALGIVAEALKNTF